jgi:hypothetical protein
MKIECFAKKTFLALQNPFNTVKDVNALAINKIESSYSKFGFAHYLGIKNTKVVPQSLISKMDNSGFLYHTTDIAAFGGRAIDVYLKNPLTNSFMTGSSSGSALNVFYNINDCAIATDGGGSVLAPAASLNLYSFISPLIEQDYLKQFSKISTDGISFSPSIGFIARDFKTLKQAVKTVFSFNDIRVADILITKHSLNSIYKSSFNYVSQQLKKGEIAIKKISSPKIFAERNVLISFLNNTVKNGAILMSIEGPIDIQGIGDTIFGHFDDRTKESQRLSGKGFMRVVNMCGKSAITVPLKELSLCALIICESQIEQISKAFCIAQTIQTSFSSLAANYFSNLDMYF